MTACCCAREPRTPCGSRRYRSITRRRRQRRSASQPIMSALRLELPDDRPMARPAWAPPAAERSGVGSELYPRSGARLLVGGRYAGRAAGERGYSWHGRLDDPLPDDFARRYADSAAAELAAAADRASDCW